LYLLGVLRDGLLIHLRRTRIVWVTLLLRRTFHSQLSRVSRSSTKNEENGRMFHLVHIVTTLGEVPGQAPSLQGKRNKSRMWFQIRNRGRGFHRQRLQTPQSRIGEERRSLSRNGKGNPPSKSRLVVLNSSITRSNLQLSELRYPRRTSSR